MEDSTSPEAEALPTLPVVAWRDGAEYWSAEDDDATPNAIGLTPQAPAEAAIVALRAEVAELRAALAQPAPTAEVALPAVSEEAERVAFEAWAESQNWVCIRNSFDEYIYETVRDGWSAWLARAQSAAKGDEGAKS